MKAPVTGYLLTIFGVGLALGTDACARTVVPTPATVVTDQAAPVAACVQGTWDMVDVGDYVRGMGIEIADVSTVGRLSYSFHPDGDIEIRATNWVMRYKNLCCEYGMNPETAPRMELGLDGTLAAQSDAQWPLVDARWQRGDILASSRSERPWSEWLGWLAAGAPRAASVRAAKVDQFMMPPMIALAGNAKEQWLIQCEGDDLNIVLPPGTAVRAPQPARLRRAY